MEIKKYMICDKETGESLSDNFESADDAQTWIETEGIDMDFFEVRDYLIKG